MRVNNCRWFLFCTESNLESGGNNDNQPAICKLRHPKSGCRALYMFTHENQKISELVKFEETCRSWLIGETVQKDGSFYIVTSIDPVFLVLPYLAKCQKFMELDCILEDSDFPESKRLAQCSLEDLEFVADVKNISGDNFYRYNKDKTLSWLRLKLERLVKALKQDGIDVTNGATIATFTRSNRTSTEEENFLRYAAGLIAEYLDKDLAKDFFGFIGVSLEVEPAVDAAAVDPPLAKKFKFDVFSPTEDYSQSNSGAAIKKTEKFTTAQKQLNKIDKAGIKSISSFFSPKASKK